MYGGQDFKFAVGPEESWDRGGVRERLEYRAEIAKPGTRAN